MRFCGKVVGADALRAVARAHHGPALGGALGLALGVLELEEPGAQDAHGLGLVLDLALLVLAVHDKARRDVGDAHRGVRRVDALAAGTRGAHDVDAQVLIADLDLGLLHLGQDGDGDGARMDPARGLGGGDALDAVHARLPAQALVDRVARDREDDLAVAAQLGGGGVHHLDLPAPGLGEVRVHAEEVRGEEGRLLAAGAGADLHDRWLVGQLVAGRDEVLEPRLEGRAPVLERAGLGLGEFAHLGVGLVPGEGLGPLEGRHDGLELSVSPDDDGEPRTLAHGLPVADGVLGQGGVRHRFVEPRSLVDRDSSLSITVAQPPRNRDSCR